MKYFINLLLIISLLFILKADLIEIEFKETSQYEQLRNLKEFSFLAKYNRKSGKKYLYVYPKNYVDSINLNKAIIKIYFKQFSDKDSINELSLNYLNSDYSSIDFNSGLFIELEGLKYDTAIIRIISYEICNLMLYYKYSDKIEFPSYSKYSNYQLNQFILKKGATVSINYQILQQKNLYLLILSKTSLRNIEITAKYNNQDITKDKLAYLYPNGLSFFIDKNSIDETYVYLTIKNKNNNNEVILLGYNHQNENELFPNEIVNGFQIYLEGNKNELDNLKFTGKANSNQYFIYQIYNKKLLIDFLDSNEVGLGNKKIIEYNSIFLNTFNINEGKMRFEFGDSPKRSAFNFQYLDYSDDKIAQKSLQSLVTGVPKAMIIPKGKSIYHFLPKERDSSNLYFYLRAKKEEAIFISFESCSSYPENCYFSGKREHSIEAIQNIGFWYSIPRNKTELQIIYIYCENECAYDILMSYEKEDPLFLFPENDYTKLISDSGLDIFALPVFESFEYSKVQSLYIDLTVISGKAKMTLKNGRDGTELKYDIKKTGNRQTYNISSDIFLKDSNYFKKEIYVFVEQEDNYKNTIYNIMYGSGETLKTKFLSNKIVNIEPLTVGEKNKESANSKIFNFINNENRNLYILISTQFCKSKVLINNVEQYESFSHSYKVPYGSNNVEIYLLNDNNLCISGFEEEVILFSYYLNQNVLLTENSLINVNITDKVSFVHIFKPNEKENSDNSFNIGIKRLNKNPIIFTYELKRISFDGLENIKSSANSSLKINSHKFRYISNHQIKKICGSLSQYDVCSLTMTFVPSSSSSLFAFSLKKNDLYFSQNLNEKSLLSQVNTKSVQYFYIDINSKKNLELLINSYGDNLKYNFEVKNKEQEDNIVLPLKQSFSDGSNVHQIKIDQSNFSSCKDFCRLYIGVTSEDSKENEVSSLFLISYQYLDDSSNFIDLPLNYFTQYTFKNSSEVNFFFNPIEDDDFTFELYVVKQNEIDNTQVIADISGAVTYQLSSSEGKCVKTGLAKEIKVKITKNIGNDMSTFKFRVSSIGKGNSFNGFIPMISSFEEKCLEKPCYYILDGFSLDNEETSAYFYIPEKESSTINIKSLKYNEKFTDSGYNISSSDKMKRPNWYEFSNINKEQDVIIKIEDNDKVTLCPSYYNKPNNVTLNYGEKRMFTLKKKIIQNIILNIKQPSISKSKVKINIHSIRGNGIFKFKEEIYPLGLENSYKEDITIIIDDNKLSNIQLIAFNEKNGKADTDNENAADFVFTIEYKIDLIDQLLYEINYDKINSYKLYRKEKIDEVLFYLDITKRPNINLNMNIKIYSNSTTYNIKSYFVDYNFIQKRLNNSKQDSGLNVTGETIKTYIQGGNSINDIFTFSKLEISSDRLQKYIKEYPFLCIVFTQKEKKNNYVKFDLYPYEMNNTIPLVKNQLFIQKIPNNNNIYKILLSKSDIFYRKNVKIDFVPPLLKEYDYSVAHYDSGNIDPKKSEDEFISDRKVIFGKEEITLNSLKNINQKNIIFNIFPKDDSNVEDSFIFSYRNQKTDEEDEIYMKSTELFNITGDSKEVKYTIHAPASKNTGHTILISRVYEFEKIKHLDMNKNNNYISLYLLFSDINPIFEKYDVLKDITIYDSKRSISNKIKKGGDLYFTAICVLEDNEREIYFAYEGIRKEIDDKNFLDDLLDYMKDHVFATIIIFIVIFIILGILINICRNERKIGRLSSVKVDIEGKLMEDKN